MCPQARAGAWPLRSYLPLGAYPRAVPCARLHARLVVAEWGLAALSDVVELTVSELVTNGVRASAGLAGSRYRGRWRPGRPPVRLWVQSDTRRVLVQVWDGAAELPGRQSPGLDGEHGRGLLLVDCLCEACGVYRVPTATGKVVWALVAGG